MLLVREERPPLETPKDAETGPGSSDPPCTTFGAAAAAEEEEEFGLLPGA